MFSGVAEGCMCDAFLEGITLSEPVCGVARCRSFGRLNQAPIMTTKPPSGYLFGHLLCGYALVSRQTTEPNLVSRAHAQGTDPANRLLMHG